MCRIILCLIFPLAVFSKYGVTETLSFNSFRIVEETRDQDTLAERQNLYNGRVWRDLYVHKVNGDEFLFTKEFLTGSVIFNGKPYHNVSLRYDIFNDEIMIITEQNLVLRLNKEMVEMFTLKYDNITHNFLRLEPDSISSLSGFYDVLHKGKTSLYVKYRKEISRLSQGRTFDVFVQTNNVFLVKDGVAYHINGKKNFIGILEDKRQQIITFIKTNKISISRNNPESYVKVLEYYDSIMP